MSGTGKPTVSIRITAEGADQARATLEKLGKDGEQALGRLNAATGAASPQLQRLAGMADVAGKGFAALAVTAVAAGAAIAKVGDTMQATLARLGAATGSTATARDIYESLFKLSQQTGIAVTDSAAAFGRFRVAATDIGATNAQVLKLVEGLQKASAVAGSTGQESAAAIQQLGQALASGVLQGDELRSLLENLPQFAQALARELGVGVGQLRQMGKDGKLTADTIFPAMLRVSEKMSAEFDKLPPTMARSFDILGGAMANFVGRLNESLRLSQGIAAAAKAAADALNGVTRAAFPSEAEQITARRATVAASIAALQNPRSDGRGQEPLGMFGSLRGDDAVRAVRNRKEALESEYRTLGDRLLEIQKEQQQAQFGEYVAAQQQAAAKRKADTRTAYDELVLSLDKSKKAREDYAKQVKKIDDALAAGSIDSGEAATARKLAADALATELAKGTHEAKKLGAELDDHVKTWQKAQEAAKKAFEAAAAEAEKFRERSLNAVADSLGRAFDRLGDALSQAFVSGGSAAVNFGNVTRSILSSLASDFVKLGVVNPIRNMLFSGATQAPTLGGAGGFNVTDLFGLSSLIPKDGLLSGLGLGGGGAGFLSGLGTVAAGFGAGTLLNSALGGNQLGGTIGAGIGSIGLGLVAGGPIGAIIGGLAGGALGGLFGPKESVRGYGYRVTGVGAEGLAPIDRTYYNESGAQQFAQADQAVAAINAYVKARGLTIGGSYIVGGNKNGADYSSADSGSFNEAFSKLFFGANDNQLNAAVSGRSFGSPEELQSFVDGWTQVRDAIRDLTDTAQQKLTRQLDAVNEQFDQLAAKAREYGLSEAGLAAARERALAAVRGQQAAEGRGLLADLAFGRSSALPPEQQYFAAISSLNQARSALSAGGSIADYAAVAQQVLPVAQSFLGTSTRYAALTAEVANTVAGAGGDPSGIAAIVAASANGMTALESTFAAYGERQLTVASATLSELRRLASSLEALIARKAA